MRTRAGLGVVLHTEAALADDLQALAHPIIEVDVCHAYRSAEPAERVGIDGEVVILAGDLDRVGDQVLDRVIAAVLTERQLDRAGPERQAEQLVTQADPEDRHLTDQLGDVVERLAALDLGEGRVLLEPRTLAKMLDALDISGGELVLDVGSALGYSSAVIAHMAEAVVAPGAHPGLRVLAPGALTGQGLALLAGKRMGALVAQLRQSERRIVYNLPAADQHDAVPEAAAAIGSVVLVMRSGGSRRSDVAALVAALDKRQASILAAMVIDVPARLLEQKPPRPRPRGLLQRLTGRAEHA